MRCEAVVKRTGEQCGREASRGSRFCRYHRRYASGGTLPGDRPSFYSDVMEEGALELEVASALHGVEDEIAVLRMLIRRVAREGDLEATRKGIETLCRALKVQYALDGRSADGLAGSLAKVLDEVGNELGMSL
ncbi:MAG TPA: hypothetical protein VHS06_08365 [Chloroflexota bacterium]|nr:hypothetical protein [Chloroflexota bacterium]